MSNERKPTTAQVRVQPWFFSDKEATALADALYGGRQGSSMARMTTGSATCLPPPANPDLPHPCLRKPNLPRSRMGKV